MAFNKANEKPSELKYYVDLSHDIEFEGRVYEKGRSVEVPRGLAILQGAVEPDPIAETKVLAPEAVQSQLQSQLSDLVTRLQDAERNNGILQTNLTNALSDRDASATKLVIAQQGLDAVHAEVRVLEAENAQQASRIASLEAQQAAAIKSETGLTQNSDVNKPAQN